MLVFVTIIPIALFAFLANQKALIQADFLNGSPRFQLLRQRFGALFDNLWVTSTASLLYNFFYLARRYFFALSIGVLGGTPPIQHFLQAFMSLGLIIYLLKCRPHLQMIDNYIEVYNELTIFLTFVFITPFLHDEGFSAEDKYNHGFVVIALIMLNVLVNFLLFAKGTF